MEVIPDAEKLNWFRNTHAFDMNPEGSPSKPNQERLRRSVFFLRGVIVGLEEACINGYTASKLSCLAHRFLRPNRLIVDPPRNLLRCSRYRRSVRGIRLRRGSSDRQNPHYALSDPNGDKKSLAYDRSTDSVPNLKGGASKVFRSKK